MKFRAVALAASLALVPPAVAQSSANGLVAGRRHLTGYFAGSWSNKFGPAFASIPTQPYAMLVGRSEYVVESSDILALSYYLEIIPAMVVSAVPHYHYGDVWLPPEGPIVRGKIWDDRALVYGAGGAPAGMQVYAHVTRMISLFGSISGGAVWFTRDMPVPDARRLNFFGDAGAGVRVARRGGRAVILGCKFHHMSNANRGPQNPGLDGNVLYAGLSKSR